MGNFLALKFDIPEAATSALIGIDDGEPVEVIEETNGVFLIEEGAEALTLTVTDGDLTETVTYDITGLTLEEADSGEE